MGSILRRSPIKYQGPPIQREIREGWEVAVAYEAEGNGPFLVDLSHVAKWDFQGPDVAEVRLGEISIPGTPGKCVFCNGVLVSRLNRVQAAVWHLSGAAPQSPPDTVYTDVTEAYALMGILGEAAYGIMEKVTPLDLSDPREESPFLIQGPVLGVTSQVVVISQEDDRFGVLIACSRGYGQRIWESILEAGREWGLCPCGQAAADRWLQRLSDLE